MKKLSLTNLSKTNLSKMQEQAIIGGTFDYCVCAALCTSCSCEGIDDAEGITEKSMNPEVESNTDNMVKGDIM